MLTADPETRFGDVPQTVKEKIMDESMQFDVLKGTAMLPACKLKSGVLRRLVEEMFYESHGSAQTFASIFQGHMFLQSISNGMVNWTRCPGLGMQTRAYMVGSARSDEETQNLCVAWVAGSREEIVWVIVKTSRAAGPRAEVSPISDTEVDVFLQERLANANWHLNAIVQHLNTQLCMLEERRRNLTSAHYLLAGALRRIDWP